MLKGIDHIVIVVRDLDAAVADYGRLGFTVVRGGRHPSMGTHNALIAFSDGAYFELIPTASPACERSPSRCRTRPLPSRFIRACSEIPVSESNARTLAVRAFALWWDRTNFSSSRRRIRRARSRSVSTHGGHRLSR